MPVSRVVRRRSVIAFRTTLVLVVLVGGGTATGAQQSSAFPRVRTTDPSIAEAIAHGKEHSDGFRRLIQLIDATDGLVWVGEGKCPRGMVRACLHMSLTISGPNRLLHILVNPRRAPGCELAASIAHELQHAWEVLKEPSIRTTPDMVVYFSRIGPTGSDRFETNEAIRVGLDVEKEVCDRWPLG